MKKNWTSNFYNCTKNYLKTSIAADAVTVVKSTVRKNKPCDFLQKNGECLLEECKPDGCKKYPYTDQPGRLGSLYGMLDAIAVCPVAYEIWERLKKIYNFH